MKKMMTMLMVLVIGISATGQVLFSDDFSDGDSAGWTGYYSPTVTVATDAIIGNGYAMGVAADSAVARSAVWAVFTDASFTKLNLDETLKLSFDFRLTNVVDGDRNFRFGLYGSDDYKGHLVRLSTGSNNTASLSYDGSGADTSILGGSSVNDYASNTAFGGINDTAKHTVVYTLTRGMDVDGVTKVMFVKMILDGTEVLMGTSSTQDWSQTAVAFASSPNSDFVIDNVSVNFVPEPATLVLLACGAISTLMRRKRS